MKPTSPPSPWRKFQNDLEAALFQKGDSAAAGQAMNAPDSPPKKPSGAKVEIPPEADDTCEQAESAASEHVTPMHWRP